MILAWCNGNPFVREIWWLNKENPAVPFCQFQSIVMLAHLHCSPPLRGNDVNGFIPEPEHFQKHVPVKLLFQSDPGLILQKEVKRESGIGWQKRQENLPA